MSIGIYGDVIYRGGNERSREFGRKGEGRMSDRDFAEYLMRQIKASGLGSQAALARATEIDVTYINRIVKRRILRPEIETLEKIAPAIKRPIDEVMRAAGYPSPQVEQVSEQRALYDEETARLAEIGRQVVGLVQGSSSIRAIRPDHTPGVSIPIVNAIAADRAQSEASQLEDRLEVPASLLHGAKQPVAFRVAGDCLALRGIVTGDHLIVDTANTTPRNGQIVAARLNGEDTAKIYCRIDAHTVELQPSLPQYPTFRAIEGTDELTIIGTFVAVWPTGRRD